MISQKKVTSQKTVDSQTDKNPPSIWGVVGLLAYLAIGLFPYLTSGLMVPGPWLYILWAVWVVGALLAWRTFRTRPLLVLLFAPAAVVFWFIYVTVGERMLGWTA